MTKTQEHFAIELAQSEIRTRVMQIREIPDDKLTPELRAERDTLDKQFAAGEIKFQASTKARLVEQETGATLLDTAGTERRELVDRSDLGRIFGAVLEHRAINDGREAEMQTEFGLESNQIPLAMLKTEHRAVTPAPGQVDQQQNEIAPYVFPQSVAAFMGVTMPIVGVGDAVYPVLTKKLDVRTPAEHAAADETTGSFSASVMTPARIQASFFYSREDRARFAGMDESLRQNLSAGLADGLDAQVIAGTNGLLANLGNHNVTSVTSYSLYRSQLGYGRVDGRYAGGIGDIRLVMGHETYGHAAGQFRSANAGDRAALEDLMAVTGGARVSAHVTAAANNRQNVIVRLGLARDMVVPIWEGLTLIPDEVSLASKGQLQITAVMLHAVKILRADGFYKQQTQHA